MKAAIFSLSFLLATFAKADTTVSAAASTSTCAADYIVETCLSSEEAIQEACGQQDYTCQCAAYQSIVTCFNNCPNDSRQLTYEGLVTQYCALASQYASTNTPAATATTSTGASGSTATATTTGTDTAKGSATGTATGSSTSSSSTANSGATLAKGAGGVMVAVAGVAAILL